MTSDASAFRHVNYSWDDAIADNLDPVGRLVYRSNILGADGRIFRGTITRPARRRAGLAPH